MPRTFKVTAEDEETQRPIPAGVIRVDEQQMVQVISAEPDFVQTLEIAANRLNGSKELQLDVPPPPDQPRGVYKRTVPRGSPEAEQAILQILNYRFGFNFIQVD